MKGFELYEYYQLFSKEIQLSYKGPFESHVLAVIGNYIGNIIGMNSKVSKKLFKIFIELAQNISYYSCEKSNIDEKTGEGILIIREEDNKFLLHAGNIVKSENVFPILDKCELINSLDRQELRKYKREQRKLPRNEFGGAHIGLIQVALTSAHPLDIKTIPINNNSSFFSITVTVDKEIKIEKK